jgi:putative selenate reductase molybdopterin-binding subunit
MTNQFKVVNTSVKKVDGLSLACGKPVFAGDLNTKGMLHVKMLSSPKAHAIIKSIDISKAESLEGVECVLCHKNVLRVVRTTAGQGYPEPSPYDSFMFDTKVRFVGDRVAAVAAITEEIAEEALKLIEVEYEDLEPVLDPKKAMVDGAPVIHDEEEAKVIIPIEYDPKKNLCAYVDALVGDPDKALAESDYVFEGEFHAPKAQHCATEPHVSSAHLDDKDRIVIVTSTQVPFHVRRIVAHTLQIPVKKIRVIKPRVGGAFGSKQEMCFEDIVAMVTMRTGRSCIMTYTREEVFVSSRIRHEQYVTLKAGLNKDGKITAFDMYVLSNTGAYGSHGLTVMCNCGSKVLPLYPTDHIRFKGHAVYTNAPVAGAYRGYGATQAAFAMEVLIDQMAEKLGVDPVEFRLERHIKEGQGSAIFQALGEGREGVEQTVKSCGLPECIKLGAEAIGWKQKINRPKDQGPIKRGIGMAALMQGSSIPEIDMASASLKINEDGSFNLLVGATDLGTGSDTVLAQIAAENLGISEEDIIVYSSDTDMTPFDVGAYASSTTYLSGMAVKNAADIVKAQITNVVHEMLGEEDSELEFGDSKVKSLMSGKVVTMSEVALRALYQENQFQIGAIGSAISHSSPPPFSAHFVEVDVDTETGKITIEKYVAAVDCGTAINPKLAEGQTEGAVLNGISYALTENYILNDQGRMLNPNFKYYKTYRSNDIKEIQTIMVPTYEPTGPYGAKSVSEISINGAMPAISNAVYHATGVRLYDAPFTADKILKALKQQK